MEVIREMFVTSYKTVYCEGSSIIFQRLEKASKVIHTNKKLFCNVVLICNLVQEFNGLVSKGLAI